MVQVRAAYFRPLLTVGDRQLPMLRARGGHDRRGPTTLQRGGDGHKLNRRVRPVHDDHLLVGKPSETARQKAMRNEDWSHSGSAITIASVKEAECEDMQRPPR
jgi:hypothetical protein